MEDSAEEKRKALELYRKRAEERRVAEAKYDISFINPIVNFNVSFVFK